MIQMAKRFFAAAAVALMAGFMSAPIAMAAPAEVSEAIKFLYCHEEERRFITGHG